MNPNNFDSIPSPVAPPRPSASKKSPSNQIPAQQKSHQKSKNSRPPDSNHSPQPSPNILNEPAPILTYQSIHPSSKLIKLSIPESPLSKYLDFPMPRQSAQMPSKTSHGRLSNAKQYINPNIQKSSNMSMASISSHTSINSNKSPIMNKEPSSSQRPSPSNMSSRSYQQSPNMIACHTPPTRVSNTVGPTTMNKEPSSSHRRYIADLSNYSYLKSPSGIISPTSPVRLLNTMSSTSLNKEFSGSQRQRPSDMANYLHPNSPRMNMPLTSPVKSSKKVISTTVDKKPTSSQSLRSPNRSNETYQKLSNNTVSPIPPARRSNTKAPTTMNKELSNSQKRKPSSRPIKPNQSMEYQHHQPPSRSLSKASQTFLARQLSETTFSNTSMGQRERKPSPAVRPRVPAPGNSLGLRNENTYTELESSASSIGSRTPVPLPRKPSIPATPPKLSRVEEIRTEKHQSRPTPTLRIAVPTLPQSNDIPREQDKLKSSTLEPPPPATIPLEKGLDSITLEIEEKPEVTMIAISHAENPNPNPSADPKAEEQTLTRAQHIQLLIPVMCLSMCVFLAAMDTTIVATALPAIASYFEALDEMNWVITSYLLTSTAVQPLYGKFANIFGRKLTLVVSVGLFLGGSLGCGLSPNILLLIIFRGVSGLGAGGLYSLAIIIISDLVPIRQRSAYMTIIGSTFAVSSVVGPIVGGLMVDQLGWQWAFYINVPIGLVAILMVVLLIRFPKTEGSIWSKLKRVDLLGCFILIFGTVTIMLGTNLSDVYSWGSLVVVWILLSGVVILFIFLLIEFKAVQEPIIPYEIFNRSTTSAFIISFLQGFILLCTIYYLPLYFQVVHLESPTNSGLECLPYLLSMVIISIGTGFAITATGSYRVFLWIGSLLMTVGTGLLSTLTDKSSKWEIYIYQILIGLGVGLQFQPALIAVQANANQTNMPIVTALLGFTRSMGGVFGISIQGTLLKKNVSNYISNKLKNADVSKIIKSISTITKLPANQLRIVKLGHVYGLKWLYISLLPITILCFLISLLIRHQPLDNSKKSKKKKESIENKKKFKLPKFFNRHSNPKPLLGEIQEKLNDSEEDIFKSLSPIPAPRPFSSFANMSQA